MTKPPNLHALRRASVVAFALLALFVRPATAQIGAGTLTGKVTDAESGKPLVDVVITVTSPALQGEQTVVTDSGGTFRVPTLPPGTYAIRYEGEGHHPFERVAVPLAAGITLRADAQLLPENLSAEEVTVVARPPTVDVGSARSGLTLDQEFTRRVPVAPPGNKGGAARSFEQLAELAPTGRNDRYGGSIAGTTSIENVYLIDGLTTSNPGFGYNGTPLSIDFIKETNVLTGGYLPEYGRGGGGVLDVVTKSGSNEFHGTFFGNITPWQAQPRFPLAQTSIRTTERQDAVRDLGFDLGGPIIKDKLWFYVGADVASQSYELTTDLNALSVGPDGKYLRRASGLIDSQAIPGSRRKAYAEQRLGQYLGKLTYSPGPNTRIELTHRGTPARSGRDGKYDIAYGSGSAGITTLNFEYGAFAMKRGTDAYDTSLRWTQSALGKRLTFDTTVGWHNERETTDAIDGSSFGGGGLASTPRFVWQRTGPLRSITDFYNIDDPSICTNPVPGGDVRCPVNSFATGGPGPSLSDLRFDRYQGREVVTLVGRALGQHVLKAGAEVEWLDYRSKVGGPGVSYSETANGANFSSGAYGGMTAPDEAYFIGALDYKVSSLGLGAFLQDSWSIVDLVTLNAGFRYDSQTMWAEQGKGLVLPNQWSPRVGVIFDPTFSGRAKLFGNYAIYYQTFPLAVMARGGSGEPAFQTRRPRRACDPAQPDYQASCNDADNFTPHPLNGIESPNSKYYYTGYGQLAIEPTIKPQSSTELSFGGEVEVIPNGRFAVTYIRRTMNEIVEDMSRDEGITLFLGNPGRGPASDFPKAERTYDAGIFSFTKTFADRWLAQASYTLSHLRGNWEGLYRAQTGQLDPGANSDFDLRDLLVNRKGDLAGDRRHEVKVFSAYDVPLARKHQLNVGLGYRSRSGAPTNVLGRHIQYGAAEVMLLPRGSGERLPWTHNLDLHVGYTFLQTKSKTISVTADIFNLLNLRPVTSIQERYTNRPVLPITGDAAKNPYVNGDRRNIDPTRINAADLDQNPRPFDQTDKNTAFGTPLVYQAPISMRFGIRSTF
ncbi:MAG: TonB-dependent receptor [Polyangiales bacterium]